MIVTTVGNCLVVIDGQKIYQHANCGPVETRMEASFTPNILSLGNGKFNMTEVTDYEIAAKFAKVIIHNINTETAWKYRHHVDALKLKMTNLIDTNITSLFLAHNNKIICFIANEFHESKNDLPDLIRLLDMTKIKIVDNYAICTIYNSEFKTELTALKTVELLAVMLQNIIDNIEVRNKIILDDFNAKIIANPIVIRNAIISTSDLDTLDYHYAHFRNKTVMPNMKNMIGQGNITHTSRIKHTPISSQDDMIRLQLYIDRTSDTKKSLSPPPTYDE